MSMIWLHRRRTFGLCLGDFLVALELISSFAIVFYARHP